MNESEILFQIGNAINGNEGEGSGHSVSLSADGKTLAVGSPYSDVNGEYSGSVKLYQNIDGTWQQIHNDIDGEELGATGWSVNLSADGNIVAIGSPWSAQNGRLSGHVRLYENNGEAWTQIGADIVGEAEGDRSGGSLSLSDDGSVVAIGAKYNNGSGHVRLYENIEGIWQQIGDDIDGEAQYDETGFSVSLSADGSVVAVGSNHNDDNGVNSGKVRLYKNIDGNWQQIGEDILGEAAYDRSGESVSLSDDGNVVAIGAIYNDNENAQDSGHVRIFENISGSWQQIGEDIDGEAADDYSNRVSLSADGTVVAIGASGNDGNGDDSGHVRLYQNIDGSWQQIGEDIDGGTAGDNSGYSLSLSSDGTTVAIGAPFNSDNGEDSGHVRVYELSPASDESYQSESSSDINVFLDSTGFDENIQNDSIVSFIDSNDSDSSNQFSYELVDGDGAEDNDAFSISGNELLINHSPDYESQSSYNIRLQATDQDGLTSEQDFHLSVNDLNESPTNLNLDSSTFDENIESGSEVALLSADDQDQADAHVYSLVSGDGDSDNHLFTVDEDRLLISETPDFENQSSYSIRLQVNDDGGLTYEKNITLSVNDINDNPSLTSLLLRSDSLAVTQIGSTIDGEAENGHSGYQVSLSSDGSLLAIGEPFNNYNGDYSGSVRLYKNVAGSWQQLGDSIYGKAEGDQFGLSTSISADGSTVAIGSPNTNNTGQVSLYKISDDTWQLISEINGTGEGDLSGYSASLSSDGNLLVIGAPGSDGNGESGGLVSLFESDSDGTWSQISDDIRGESGDRLGTSVSFSADGTVVAVSAPQGGMFEEGPGDESGYVRLYNEDSDFNWVQVGTDIPGEAGYDHTGNFLSLSADGNIVAIGSTENDGNGEDSGHVRIYQNIQGNWQQIGEDIDGEAAGDFSGPISLSADGSTVAIGASANDGNGDYSGHVRLFTYSNGSWQQIGDDIDGQSEGDQFGISVSLTPDGQHLAVGAFGGDGNGINSGYVNVYDLPSLANQASLVSFDENIDIGSAVALLSSEDQDPGDSHSYSLVSGDGDDDNSFFVIDGDKLVVNDALDYESQSSYSIRVQSSDQNGGTFEKSYTLELNDINERPSDIRLISTGPLSWTQIGEDIDGEAAEDNSGNSVSLSADGRVLAIGAYGNDGNGSYSGHVRLYENIDGFWQQIGHDINGEAESDVSGASVQLSANGKVVAIGAYGNDSNGDGSGHVRVYQNIDGSWQQIGEDIDGEAEGDSSGHSVSLSADGTFIAIGAPFNDGNGSKSGHVRLYENIDGTWQQVGNDIDGEGQGYWLGYSVSLSDDGTVVAIGEKNNSENGLINGQVRIYENIEGSWQQIGSDIDGEAQQDEFGGSVSLSSDGSVVAIGSTGNDGNGDNSGQVQVYQNIAGTWQKIGIDINGEASDDLFGHTVTLSSDGTILAIGATHNDDNGLNSGHVRLYKNIDGAWQQIGEDINGEAAYDTFGRSVSLSSDGSIVAIGATGNDGNGSNSGHVRVFSTDSSPIYLNENIDEQSVVATLNSSDPDSNNIFSYEFVDGDGSADNNAFSIVGNELIINQTPDFESQSSYTVRLQTTDQDGKTFEKSVILDVKDLNESPSGLTSHSSAFDENISAGSEVSLLTADDVDQTDSHSFSLVSGEYDTDNHLFSVDGDRLIINESPDYETKSFYDIRLQVMDQEGETSQGYARFYTNDVNETPTDIVLDDPLLLHTFDNGDTHGWSNGKLDSSNAWGSHLGPYANGHESTQNNFAVNGSVFKIEFDFLRIDSWDGEKFFIDINDERIVSQSFSHSYVNSTYSGTVDKGGVFDWIITPYDESHDDFAGASWSDQRFKVEITTPEGLENLDIKFSSSLDQSADDESWGIDNFTIISSGFSDYDSGDSNDQDSQSTISVFDENIAIGSAIASLRSSDQDSNSTFIYELVNGDGASDNDLFSISGDQLVLNHVPDYEIQSSFSVRLKTSDQDGASFEKVFSFGVNDVNDNPTDIYVNSSVFEENIVSGSEVARLSAEDQDSNDTFSYLLSTGAGDTDNHLFAIDGDRLFLNQSPDYETKSSYSIRALVTDSQGLQKEETFAFSVDNVDEAPKDIVVSSGYVRENIKAGLAKDGLDVLDQEFISSGGSFSLVSGTGDGDNSRFTIQDNQLILNELADYEEQSSYSIRIATHHASRESFEKIIQYQVIDTNVEDDNKDGLVDNRSRYELMSDYGTSISLKNKRGTRYSDSSSRNWDALASATTEAGYEVLLKGSRSQEGKYLVWTTNDLGVITNSSGWITAEVLMRSGYEEMFNLDLNNDSVTGVPPAPPVLDDNSDGLVDGSSSYALMSADGTAITLSNSTGRKYSDQSSRYWDVAYAVSTDSGYEVLLEGQSRYEGRYMVWTTDQFGVTTNRSGWRSSEQLSDQGYEVIFGMDFNLDSVIGTPPVIDENSDGLADNHSEYVLMNSETTGVKLTNNTGKVFSADSSSVWNVIAATSTNSGFEILASGDQRYAGKFLQWTADQFGVITNSSGWKSISQALDLGFEDTFNLDLNLDSVIGAPPVLDANSDGIVDGSAYYELMSADGTGLLIRNKVGTMYTDESSHYWDVKAATPTDIGYQVLLEGESRKTGNYLIWTTDLSGVITNISGWISAEQSVESGYEVLFDLDLNNDSIIGLPPASDYNLDGLVDNRTSYELMSESGTGVKLTTSSGRDYSESSSSSWDVISAIQDEAGYQVLVEGESRFEGRYFVWSTDMSGVINSNSGWKSVDQSVELGYEEMFKRDLNNDSVIGQAPVLDENSDGLVDNRSNYELFSGDNTSVKLTNRSGREYSDDSSSFWDVIAAVEVDAGYQVLLEGGSRHSGKYLQWTADESGVITKSSGWKTLNQSVELGFEEVFGLDLNSDGNLYTL